MKILNFNDCVEAERLFEGRVTRWDIAFHFIVQSEDIDKDKESLRQAITAELGIRKSLSEKVKFYQEIRNFGSSSSSKVFDSAFRQCQEELCKSASQEERWNLINMIRGVLTVDIILEIFSSIYWHATSHQERMEVIKKAPNGYDAWFDLAENALLQCKSQKERWDLVNLVGAYGLVYKVKDNITSNAEKDLAKATTKEEYFRIYEEAPNGSKAKSKALMKYLEEIQKQKKE